MALHQTMTTTITTLPETNTQYCIIYPAYLAHHKTLAEGRRLPRHLCPTTPVSAQHIRLACSQSLRLEARLELEKRYPRDPWTYGRVRVQLRNSHGKYIHRTIHTKQQLLHGLAEVLPEIQVQYPTSEADKAHALGGAGNPLSLISDSFANMNLTGQQAGDGATAPAVGTSGKGKGKGKKGKKGKK